MFGPIWHDPRYTQIGVLSCLVAVGALWFNIGVGASQLMLSVLAAVLGQYACCVYVRTPFDWRSALITGLSLSLLLRMNEPLWAVVAALIAIVSKFLMRLRGRHIFNPANFAIVVLLLADAPVWVSPGQWGSAMVFGLLLVLLGISVLLQTRQWDIAFAFLASYAVLLGCRAFYLGDGVSIVANQLQSGALLIFAFFMLSDPKTIPAHSVGRCVFAVCVAGVAFYLQFFYYLREAIFFALFISSIGYSGLKRFLPIY